MVEFGLALPVLLTILYGLLETGRLAFIYASAVTAARQAARYGSTTGRNAGDIPYYRDCDGIRSAVQKVGFINRFEDSDIYITYDRGLDEDGDVIPIPSIDPSPTANTCTLIGDDKLRNGDRIKVQVSAQWSPIIAIVPSWQGFTITSSAERTFLVNISLSVDPQSQAWIPGGSGALQLNVSASPTTFSAPGQVISYTYVLTNSGTIDLTDPFTVADDHATEDCSAAPASLSPGSSLTCTGTYSITQADLDAGQVTNLAVASSFETTSEQVGTTVTAIQNPALALVKTPSQPIVQNQGTQVTYTYSLTNSGNVTLSAPYSISDNKINSGQLNCSGAASPLAPGTTTTCTGTYVISGADVANGSVTNFATATASFSGLPVSSNVATATVITSPLSLTVSPSIQSVSQLNQQIVYTYTLKNISNSNLTYPYQVTDDLVTGVSCPFNSSLAPGESTTCSGSYFVTQADLDAGGTIENHAIASASAGSQSVHSNMATGSVTVVQIPALALNVLPSSQIVTSLNSSITYTYLMTNTGNVTLSAPYSVTDLSFGSPSCTLTTSLAPQASTTCTLGHVVSQADLNNGSIINQASATAQFASQPVLSPQGSATVITHNSPRLSLSISSMPDKYTSAGAILNFQFTLRNTGNSLLTSPYTVNASSFLGTVNCSNAAAQLVVGQMTNCTASYTTTSADMTAGAVTVVATASAMSSGTTITSGPATLAVPSVFQCFIYHRSTTTQTSSITFPGSPANKMSINLINDSATGGTIHISRIEVHHWNYSSHSSQFIKTISLGGITIYEGSIAQRVDPMYYTGPFIGDVSIPPGTTKTLLFTFNKNYTPTGNELIKVTFSEVGCPVLDSSNNTQVK
jgi:hypothetical protein